MSRLPAILALCFAVALVFVSAPAAAQDGGLPSADSLTTDGEIREQATLVIEQPAEGENVKTPFTVAGRAPAGAQLELWLGNALERVFKADQNGRFTAAISEELDPDTKIWVHQVGARGRRVQSTSVVVNWGGEADKRDPQLVGKPPVGGEAVVAAPPEEESISETPPPPTSGAGELPSVEELGGGDLTTAPVPPPVDEAAGVDPFETADQLDPFDASADTSARDQDRVFRRPPPSRGLRILAETGAGIGGALVGGLALGFIGLAFDIGAGSFVPVATIIGGFVGFYAGMPAGVILAGHAMQGNGSILATIGGEVLGILIGGLLTSATFGQASPTLLILPLAGAVSGYEITSDRSRFQQSAGIRSLRPTVSTTADGTGTVYGLRMRF